MKKTIKMKKTLLYVFVCVGFMNLTTAQEIWSDNFDDSDISDWTVKNIDGKTDGSETNIWKASLDVQLNSAGNQFVYTTGTYNVLGAYAMADDGSVYSNGNATQNDWVISPEIDLSGNANKDLTVTVNAQPGIYASSGQQLKFYIGYAPDDFSDVTNTFFELESKQLNRNDPAAAEFTDYTVNIPANLNVGGGIYLAIEAVDYYSVEIDKVTLSVGGALSVNSKSKKEFKIKQNPVTDKLQFVANAVAVSPNNTKVNIYNINGMLLKTTDYTEGGIEVGNLVKGLYIATVQTPTGITSLKFIKK